MNVKKHNATVLRRAILAGTVARPVTVVSVAVKGKRLTFDARMRREAMKGLGR